MEVDLQVYFFGTWRLKWVECYNEFWWTNRQNADSTNTWGAINWYHCKKSSVEAIHWILGPGSCQVVWGFSFTLGSSFFSVTNKRQYHEFLDNDYHLRDTSVWWVCWSAPCVSIWLWQRYAETGTEQHHIRKTMGIQDLEVPQAEIHLKLSYRWGLLQIRSFGVTSTGEGSQILNIENPNILHVWSCPFPFQSVPARSGRLSSLKNSATAGRGESGKLLLFRRHLPVFHRDLGGRS